MHGVRVDGPAAVTDRTFRRLGWALLALFVAAVVSALVWAR